MRALRLAPFGCGGRPWRGCFPPTSANARAACGARVRIVAALTDPTSIRPIWRDRAAGGAPPRAPPQPLFEFAA